MYAQYRYPFEFVDIPSFRQTSLITAQITANLQRSTRGEQHSGRPIRGRARRHQLERTLFPASTFRLIENGSNVTRLALKLRDLRS